MSLVNGWLDWANVSVKGNPTHVNGGINPAGGIFLHSAEGYNPTLLEEAHTGNAPGGPVSWHFTNCLDGSFYQHYPITTQCWHATAANNNFLGMENEGEHHREQSLNSLQVANAIRCIEDISKTRAWIPNRDSNFRTRTLWEHREVVELGGSGSECPDGRIPWDLILKGIGVKNGLIKEGNFQVLYNDDVPVWRWGSNDGQFPGRVSKNFGGVWLWLKRTEQSDSFDWKAVWSSEEGD